MPQEQAASRLPRVPSLIAQLHPWAGHHLRYGLESTNCPCVGRDGHGGEKRRSDELQKSKCQGLEICIAATCFCAKRAYWSSGNRTGTDGE